MSNRMEALPKRWVQVKKALEDDDWKLDRISGSHHIFTKQGARCIPLAFHGGTISPQYAARVLRQAGLHDQGLPQSYHDDDERSIEAHKPPANPSNDTKQQSNPRRPVKALQEQELEKKRNAVLLHEQFQELELAKHQEQQKAESERMNLLERVQEQIAAGHFVEAIDSTSVVNTIDDIGSSSVLWQFRCDILFFRTVALSEHAFSSYSFNSEYQRKEIDEALILINKFMESSPERRQEAREFASNLQRRVIRVYIEGLSELYQRYVWVDLAVRTDNGSALPPGMEHVGSLVASPCEANKLMNELVSGFEFLIVVTKAKHISLANPIEDDDIKCIIEPIVTVCVRKMLISFDEGDYNSALRSSDVIFSTATDHGEFLRLFARGFSIAFCTSTLLVHSSTSPELLVGIAEHVKALIPVYRFANEALHWNRFAGVLADVAKPPSDLSGQLIDFESTLTFLHQLTSSMRLTQAHLPLLVVSNQTRQFIFDTFTDPMYLANIALHKVILKDEHVAQRILPVLKRFGNASEQDQTVNLDSFLLCKPEFRKSRYDKIRAQSLRLCMALLQISNIYDELLEVDPLVKKETVSNNLTFKMSRYEKFPEAVGFYLVTLMKFVFGPDNVTVSLLCQTIVMNIDLDLADNYFVEIEDGKTVGQTKMAGGKKTPEATRAAGIWSLSLTFNIMMRLFLFRFASAVEMKRLLLIDHIALDESFLAKRLEGRTEHRVESLAFDLIVKLSGCTDSLPTSTNVDRHLQTILNNASNHQWCHLLSTEAKRKQWAKRKSQRFSKLIARLHHGLADKDMSGHLTQRSTSVQYLMDKLQRSVQSARGLPENLRQSIQRAPTDDKIVKACTYLEDWTRQELYLVREHMVLLEKTAEEVTGYFSSATGGAFPRVFASTSPRWTISHHTMIINGSFTSESLDAIRDLKYVHAILTAHSADETS